jgi:hypothetical protein
VRIIRLCAAVRYDALPVKQDRGGWRRINRRHGDASGDAPYDVFMGHRHGWGLLCGPGARELTDGETRVLRAVFGSSVDLANTCIVDGPGRNPAAAIAFNIGGNPALTAGDTVYVRSDYHVGDFSAGPVGINTLAHEFAHVRQYQRLGYARFLARYAHDLVTIGDRNRIYDYHSRARDFASETIEGQAQMIGDYAGYRAGERRISSAQLASLEHKLCGTGIHGL